MDYLNNLNVLRNNLEMKSTKKGLTHNTNKTFPVLPFPTREPERAKFESGFNGVIGEFVRIISNKKLVKHLDSSNNMDKIIEKVQVNEEDKPYFEEFIKQYLNHSSNDLMIFHPSVFKFFELTKGNEAKGEVRIAHFLRDIFSEKDSLKFMFEKDNINDVIAKLVLESLDNLEDKITKHLYINQLTYIEKLFNEDVAYLHSHKEYFLKNFGNLVAYYYFFYITQFSLKLSMMEKANYNEVTEEFYLLDWEKASKTRASYKKGFTLIKESGNKLITHVNTLEHLNAIFGTIGKNYVDLQTIFDNLEESEKENLLETLSTWIKEYRVNTSMEPLDLESKDYEELLKLLKDSIDNGIGAAIKSRYGKSIKEIANKFFLKRRGSLGDLLNINQDFLLLLTSICVKNERMPLKELFMEYEKRGLFFDRYSKELIVELFDKLNLIEKISDSGDAQYVKPIL
jgi:DNA phosphorothioation-dependent restriction protein DptG